MNGLSRICAGVLGNYIGGWMQIHTNIRITSRKGYGIYFCRLSSERCDDNAVGWKEINFQLGPIGYEAFLMSEQTAPLEWARGIAMDLESTLPSAFLRAIANIKFGPATKEWLPIKQVGIWTGIPSWLHRIYSEQEGDITLDPVYFHFGFEMPSVVLKEGEILRFHQSYETQFGGMSLPFGYQNKWDASAERGPTNVSLLKGKLEPISPVTEEFGFWYRANDWSMASMLCRHAGPDGNFNVYEELGNKELNSKIDPFFFPVTVCPPYLRLTLHNEDASNQFMTDTPDLDDVWAGASFGVVSNNIYGPYKYFWGMFYDTSSRSYKLYNNAYITWMDFYPYLFGSKPNSLGIAWYYLENGLIVNEIGAFMFDVISGYYVNYLDIPVTLQGDIAVYANAVY